MAYDTAVAVPICQVPRVGSGVAIWTYNSADVHTDVDAVGYFTDGHARGMRVGDIVFVSKTTATIGTTVHYVSISTAGGAASVEAAILA